MYHEIEHTSFLSRPPCPSVRGQNPFPRVIASHAAPCGNHEANPDTAESPAFGHYPREMAEVLSSVFLPFLRFIQSSAAPMCSRSGRSAYPGDRAVGRAGHPIGFVSVHALTFDGVPRLLRRLGPAFLTDHCIVFAQRALTEQNQHIPVTEPSAAELTQDKILFSSFWPDFHFLILFAFITENSNWNPCFRVYYLKSV